MDLRNIFRKKTDGKKEGEAATTKDTDVVAEEAPDDIPFGLDIWVEGVDPVVDIVAIHGLNGHQKKTWTAKNKVNWLRDANMLPANIPNARIMSWGYDANTHSTKELSAMHLYDHGQTLVSDLSLHRRTDKGGQGVAWGKRLVNVASIFVKTNSKLLNILERDSEILQQQLHQYNSISGDFETKFAFETKATPLALGKAMIVVPKSSASLIQSLLLIASRLPKGQIPGIDSCRLRGLDESRKAAQDVLQWFTLEDNTQWLLIFDNIDKTSYEEEESDQRTGFASYDITQYFPRSDAGSIIITTRLQRLVSLGSAVPLRKLSVLDGLLILEQHVRRKLRRNAVALVERLGRLPLALVFAGSYISKTTIVKYLELYNKSWAQLHGQMKKRSDYPERTIITTWQISFEEIKLRDEGAAMLLRLWGYLDNQELWYQLLLRLGRKNAAPGWLRQITASEVSFLATIGTLLDFSLIEQNDNSETYSMHAVVHDWIQASNDMSKDEGLLQTAITTIGLAVPGEDTRDSTTTQRRLLPHLIQLLQYWSDVTEVQDYVDNAVYLDSLEMLGNLCVSQGKLAESEEMFQRALRGKEKALGAEHTSTLGTVHNLAILYTNQSKLAESEEMLQRVLRGFEKALGVEHTSTLGTVHNLGNIYTNQSKLVESEEMLQRALRGFEKTLGVEHVSTIHTVHNLGNLYTNQGKLAEAEKMYQRALRGFEKALGVEHMSTLSTAHNLANLYTNQGKLAEAEKMYQRALRGKDKALGAEHTLTLSTVHNLAILYTNQSKLAESEEMLQRVLRGYKKALGAGNITTYIPALNTMWGLGSLFELQADLGKAKIMYSKALLGYEKVVGPDHPRSQSLQGKLHALATKTENKTLKMQESW
ncbi:hypothetical protein OIDMADRAFT_120076 [Oidiodendron maius Zn]|uniref:NB-ARC domain-containing protein n=1 Tax=Oidiodendron maius (strain Zn) TaxID=913774 RepID=A0A0C3CUR5_OIDMZ|nr:hypothetical protein OIDMADRAFT_120076 [Oidiodendron maius Zn]